MILLYRIFIMQNSLIKRVHYRKICIFVFISDNFFFSFSEISHLLTNFAKLVKSTLGFFYKVQRRKQKINMLKSKQLNFVIICWFFQ